MTGADVELLDGEQLMSDADELAYRQIAPHMLVDDGKIATTAFGPNTSDSGKPSFSRQAEVSPQDARDWHSKHANSPSQGVWAVSVGRLSNQVGMSSMTHSALCLRGRCARPDTVSLTSGGCHDRSARSCARSSTCTPCDEARFRPTTPKEDGQLFA